MKELIRCDVTFLLLVISVELLVGASVGVVRPLHLPAAPMQIILNTSLKSLRLRKLLD